MSEILGFDCNGRPLRTGDKIEVIDAPVKPEMKGCLGSLTGGQHGCELYVDFPGRGLLRGPGRAMRRINNRDDQPANQSFSQLMTDLKGRVSNPDEVVA